MQQYHKFKLSYSKNDRKNIGLRKKKYSHIGQNHNIGQNLAEQIKTNKMN